MVAVDKQNNLIDFNPMNSINAEPETVKSQCLTQRGKIQQVSTKIPRVPPEGRTNILQPPGVSTSQRMPAWSPCAWLTIVGGLRRMHVYQHDRISVIPSLAHMLAIKRSGTPGDDTFPLSGGELPLGADRPILRHSTISSHFS